MSVYHPSDEFASEMPLAKNKYFYGMVLIVPESPAVFDPDAQSYSGIIVAIIVWNSFAIERV